MLYQPGLGSVVSGRKSNTWYKPDSNSCLSYVKILDIGGPERWTSVKRTLVLYVASDPKVTVWYKMIALALAIRSAFQQQ